MCAFLGEGAEDGFFFAGGGGGGGQRVGVLDEQVAEVEGVGLRFTVVGGGCCCHVVVVVVGFVWAVRERCESVWFLRTKVSKVADGLSPIWPCAASESGPQRWVLTATRQG